VGEPGSNGSDGITCVFVRKVIDLAFEKNLMRANAVDFKNCSVGVVDFVKPELVPVLVVMTANALRRVCTAGEANIGTVRIRCPASDAPLRVLLQATKAKRSSLVCTAGEHAQIADGHMRRGHADSAEGSASGAVKVLIPLRFLFVKEQIKGIIIMETP
jgi:hypothetical protein